MSSTTISTNIIESDNNNNINDCSVQDCSMETFPRPPPHGGYCYSYYQGGCVTTRVIHMDGDVAQGEHENADDDDIISSTFVVNSLPNVAHETTTNNKMIRRLAYSVSPPPGFDHAKPKTEEDYDCIIRERRSASCRQQQQQPLSWDSLWESLKRSHHLNHNMMMQQDGDAAGPCCMMGLVQYPSDVVGRGGTCPKLEFWILEGQGASNGNPPGADAMVRLDGTDMIRKVRSVNNSNNKDEEQPKKKQFLVHLIDANVFVPQDSDQVVQAIEKLMETYGRFCPQGDDDNNHVIAGPVEDTTAQEQNVVNVEQSEQSWLVYEGFSDDLTLETVQLQDEDDEDDNGSVIYNMNNNNLRRGYRLRRRMHLGAGAMRNLSRRLLFRRTPTTHADVGVVVVDVNGGVPSDGRRNRRGGRPWTALNRGTPVHARNDTGAPTTTTMFIDV